MASPTEVAAMRRALELAQSPDAPVGPNPRVGCVLLRPDGSVLAEGYGRGAGNRHGEADALFQAGGRADGATAVVTLEPCNHVGRTASCAVALRDAGVRRVVFGQADTNPIAGGGADTLRAAGVDTEGGVLAEEARAVNPIWTFAVAHGRPYVTWKFAAALDGRSAAADGTSQWITSEAARADVQRLRAECDTILVGTGTVLADDPGRHPDAGHRSSLNRPLRRGVEPEGPDNRPHAKDQDGCRTGEARSRTESDRAPHGQQPLHPGGDASRDCARGRA
jgi:diaminohydroxyphosphoribosylaminopyrimidine deaminase/5-amino-6-(5-phosphoribosylamino)uracil reductase